MQIRGRLLKKYSQKKIIFLLINTEGHNTRCILKKDGFETFDILNKELSIGDILYCEGESQLGTDQKAELLAREVIILQKSLLSSLETGLLENSKFDFQKSKFYYHTLMLNNSDAVCFYKVHNEVFHTIVSILNKKDFSNVSTPILQHNFYAGGARPFITHMLDNDSDMYLRITSEIAIKLLIAGGLSKVYEIGSYFRNGSIDKMHTVPFIALEAYQSDVPYEVIQKIAEEILAQISNNAKKIFREYNKQQVITFEDSIPECTFEEYLHSLGFCNFCIDDIETYPNILELKGKSNDIIPNSKMLYKWFKQKLIKNQKSPIWISDLPAGQSPFIKKKDPYRLYRKYLVANGATLVEVAEGEKDPTTVEENLKAQYKFQINHYPHDYAPIIHAYKLGLPTICSLFISIDRIYQALAGEDDINKYKMYI